MYNFEYMESIISFKNLTKKFNNITAVDNINMTFSPGKITGILGPNGAGKSTSVKCFTGVLKPTSGEIMINNENIINSNGSYKTQIGYVPENPVIYKTLTGFEYLNFIGSLYQVSNNELSIRIKDFMDKFYLKDKAHNHIQTYSKGMIQKLVVIGALLHNPNIFIFDEPFGGLDAKSVLVLREFIKALAKGGKTVIFCSHILEVVEKMCDHIYIMKNGQVLLSGTSEEIVTNSNTHNLEEAFIKLTGQVNVEDEVNSLMDSLE